MCKNCGHSFDEHYVKRRDGIGPMHCAHADEVPTADGDWDNNWCHCTEYRGQE